MKLMAKCLIAACLVLMATASATRAEMTGSLAEQTYSMNDNNKLYVTVVGTKEDARYQELTKLFATNKDYSSLKDKSHYHSLSTDQTMFKARYANDYTAFPTVRVQSKDGTIVKEWSGASVPDSKELLADMQCLPRWRKPQPCPPQPAPTPKPEPAPEPKPEYPHAMAVWMILGALLIGVVGAAYNELSKN
jgi:hypothetical protein